MRLKINIYAQPDIQKDVDCKEILIEPIADAYWLYW